MPNFVFIPDIFKEAYHIPDGLVQLFVEILVAIYNSF